MFRLAMFGLLAAWAVTSFAIVRTSERRVTGRARPYPRLALACALAVAAGDAFLGDAPESASGPITALSLIAASGADRRTGYLFDAITLPTAILAAAAAIAAGASTSALLGIASTAGVFGTCYLCTGGRWLGLGDVKAMYAIGASFGPLGAWWILLGASASGIVAACAAGRMRRGATVAFAPHLAFGCTAVLFAESAARRLAGG
jgi:prepilin signal peptidase PulO-like enzyme (type II secretory pathway)